MYLLHFIVGDLYCDIPLGLYIIREKNVVMIGELDVEKEELPAQMVQVSETEIKRAQNAEKEEMLLTGTKQKRMEFLDLDYEEFLESFHEVSGDLETLSEDWSV
ncbi:sm-like protein LSM1A [Eutrema salsugineum]|uniref:sm-like protein LSM1A n=1 Tax=Eutrema salsugineum TaxID=72664 RepID=UPI000CECE784|nr:sm-like protein LSM1A [Eutrema salsugineum]